MAETLSTLSIVFYIVAGVALAFTVFLWFFYRIPRVISDLSGRTARKSIARMRGEKGSKAYRSSKTNRERGKLTDAILPTPAVKTKNKKEFVETGLLKEETTAKLSDETEELGTQKATNVLYDSNATMPLQNSNATMPLNEANETVILNESPSTMSLHDSGDAVVLRHNSKKKKLKMIDEVELIHTDEVIE